MESGSWGHVLHWPDKICSIQKERIYTSETAERDSGKRDLASTTQELSDPE